MAGNIILETKLVEGDEETRRQIDVGGGGLGLRIQAPVVCAESNEKIATVIIVLILSVGKSGITVKWREFKV